MAIANSDGSIVLSTKVDDSGIKKGTQSLKSEAAKLAAQYRKAGMSQSEAFKKAWSEIERTKVSTEKATKSTQKYNSQIQKVSGALKSLLGYFIGIQTVMSAINFSKEASNLAIEQEASVQRLIDIYGVASEEVGNFIDLNARALGMSKASAVGFSAVYGNLFSVWADQATNAELTNQYLNMTAVIASKTGRTVEDVQERVRSGLLGNTEAIEDLGVFVNVKTIEMTEAFQRVADGRSWEQLTAYEQSQVRTLAILEQSTKKYGDQVADTNTLVRAQYLASYQDLQATWGQFVNAILIPVLRVATKVMDILAIGLRTIAGLTGRTLENTSASANSIGGAVDNQEKLTDAVKGTNKELKKSLAGFDELNTLSQDTSSGASSGGGSSAGVGGVGGLSLGKAKGSGISEEVNSTILSIMGVVGVGLVAIGLILCVTGNIAWGVGFIIAGAGLLGVTMATLKSDAISQEVKDSLSNVLLITGIVAIIVGILCCIAQFWGVGIGLIVTGALTVGGTVALNWQGIKNKVNEALENKTLTKHLLVIGVLLLGNPVFWSLAIPMIAVGVAGIAKQQKITFEKIKNTIKAVFKEIGDWVKIFGTLVLGIMLCVSGVGLPLGIALILSGAGHIADKVTIYWNLFGDKIKAFFNGLINWVKTWGLLVLGIILMVSGVGINLGLALIYKGAKNLTEAKDPTWNALLERVKATWQAVKAYWNANIAKYFTATWWGNLAKNAINGFLKWIVSGLNKLIEKLNGFSFNLPDVFGGNKVGFNVPKLSIPQLAKGAILPPNKPFLAMVGDQKSGTNVEAPLDTIVDAMKIALGGSKGFNGRIEVPLYLNGKQIALAIRDAENELGTQTVFGGFANAY